MRRTVAFLTGLSEIEVREDDIKEPGRNELLIQIRAIGICGSDVSYYTRGTGGIGYIVYPHIPGHECAGVVMKTGEGVQGFKTGDRVAIEPGVPCGKCEYCLSGKYNLCKELSFMSTAVIRKYGEGGMASHVIRPAQMLFKLPDEMTFEQGAMLEPLSVALHALHRSGLKPGQRAAILGCGPIAGCVLEVLNASGIGDVYMTDVIPARIDRMKKLGAKDAYNTSGMPEEQIAGLLSEEVDGVFDTTANAGAINGSVPWLKKGGSITLIGVPHQNYDLQMNAIFNKEISIHTSFRYVNTYREAISMVASGKLKPERLITHRFPLWEAEKAMKLAASRDPEVLKVILNP